MMVKKQRDAQTQADKLILGDFANLVENDPQKKSEDFRMTGLSMGEDLESARPSSAHQEVKQKHITKLVNQIQN